MHQSLFEMRRLLAEIENHSRDLASQTEQARYLAEEIQRSNQYIGLLYQQTYLIASGKQQKACHTNEVTTIILE